MAISYKKVRFCAVIYAVIPIIIFYIGWLSPLAATALTILTAAGVLFFLKNNVKDDDDVIRIDVKSLVIAAIIALAWCFLAGQGAFIHQSNDNVIRNAIMRDLIRLPWPVIYSGDQMLSYYIAHWMVPAAFGKGVMLITGSVDAGFLVGRIVLFIWSTIGIYIAFILLSVVTAQKGRGRIILPSLIFIFFSGLDIVGTTIMNNYMFHLEWWTDFAQFSSFSTCLFWVYNQFIVSLIITLCIIKENSIKNFAFLGILAFPFGPFPFVGIVLICVLKAIVIAVGKLREKKLGSALKDIFSLQNIIMIIAVGVPFSLYYMSSKIISNDFSVNGEHINTGFRLLDVFSRLTSFSDIMSFIGKYLLFIFLEAGIYLIIIFAYHKSKRILNVPFILSSVTLLFIPLFQIGTSFDFSMRVSIPALIYIAVEFIKMLSTEIPIGTSGKELIKLIRNNYLLVAALAIFFFGTFTPLTEYNREILNTISLGAEKPTDDNYLYSLEEHPYKLNFTSQNYSYSIFCKYLMK